ncbi:uncharacterized protein BYT42DRAFT_563058 [Radiomyces spectabilis]|uniref:uncharacterized protein n=1 Tax=Radiomyces spectabilis TaxID=64574 RepID=UPI002220E241|nr:uncharacterized protein BYT42DRAFT_563058 [Radiomyces spectabilis]KAI8384605.1 hypothetical protein BYT42DRAFT_563058 [Radiomyces spectabilis]
MKNSRLLKQKFTPAVVPKNVILHDTTKKIHVTFDDNEPTTTTNSLSPKKDEKPKKEKKEKKDKKSKKDKKDGKNDAKDTDSAEKPPKKKRHHPAHDPPAVVEARSANVDASLPVAKKAKIDSGDAEQPKVNGEKKALPNGHTVAKASSASQPTQQRKRPRPANDQGKDDAKKTKPLLIVNKKQVEKKKLTKEETLAKVAEIRQKKREKRRAKLMVGDTKVQIPVMTLKPAVMKQKLSMKEIQDYILYCLAEAKPPQWISVVNRSKIQRFLFIYAQGLDITFFGADKNRVQVPTSIALDTLDKEKDVGKAAMPFLTSCFSQMLINKISGNKGKIMSPVQELLQCKLTLRTKALKHKELMDRQEKVNHNMREFYVLTLDELRANGYPIPSCLDASQTLPEGWKETNAVKETVPEKRIMAVDCEMVATAKGSALARVTLVDEDGKILLDDFVKPDEPVIDYLTQYSGITPEIMEKATCSLRRAQKHFRKIVNHNVILVGHSLENDLRALQIAHPYCADTALLYDHFRGPPFKPALRVLSRNILKRQIQEHNKATFGHDSAEDAKATLDLFRLKLRYGPHFGRFGKETELLFDRLRHYNPPKKGAILESANTVNGMFRASLGNDYERCETDEQLVDAVARKLVKTDFVLSRFRVLEHGEQSEELAPKVLPESVLGKGEQAERLARFDDYLQQLYQKLPSSTAVVIMGGTGDVPQYQQ